MLTANSKINNKQNSIEWFVLRNVRACFSLNSIGCRQLEFSVHVASFQPASYARESTGA